MRNGKLGVVCWIDIGTFHEHRHKFVFKQK